MKIAKKEWTSYINKLAKISDVAAKEMTAYIKLHPHASRYSIISMANAIATKYGEVNGALSCQMYDEIANKQKAKVPPAEMAPTATMQESGKMVNALYKTPLQIPGAVGRQVKQVGADTMLKNAKRDGAEFAWISSGDGCVFCRTLSSRGWQKASKKTIQGDHATHIHNHCRCEFAIRFDNTLDVEGYDPQKYLDEYENAEGNTSKEKINYMRREQRRKDKETLKNKGLNINLSNDKMKIDKSVIYLGQKEDLSKYELDKVAPAQEKHIVDSNSYKNLAESREYPPSYITISKAEVSKLVKKYAGKGINQYNRKGEWTNTEIILTNKKMVGFVVNNINGKSQKTNVFKIHYSKRGVHIVPDYMKKRKRYMK